MIKTVDEFFNNYDLTNATRAIQAFVIDDVSNWYVRLNRKRFWVGEYNADKKAAYQTLCECLEKVARLGSPIAPFYFEQLFSDLNAVNHYDELGSVHLGDFPVADDNIIDSELELRMSYAQRISSLVHSLRKGEQIKVRQPLQRILIPASSGDFKAQVEAIRELIKTEVNIKEIEYIEDASSSILVRKVKPNFAKLGKQFGKNMKIMAGQINQMSQEDIITLETTNAFEIEVAREKVSLSSDDVEINFQDIEGWLVTSDAEITVALDIHISSELREEGLARDVVNRVQNLRKEMGLEVQDKINITVENNNELISAALQSNNEYICTETQAVTLQVMEKVADAHEIEIDDLTLKLKIEVN